MPLTKPISSSCSIAFSLISKAPCCLSSAKRFASLFSLISAITRTASLFRSLKMMMSSKRFLNSGGKRSLIASITAVLLLSSAAVSLKPTVRVANSLFFSPIFVVARKIVFSKFSTLPLRKIIRPSSNGAMKALKMSGCDFSNSSRSTTLMSWFSISSSGVLPPKPT